MVNCFCQLFSRGTSRNPKHTITNASLLLERRQQAFRLEELDLARIADRGFCRFAHNRRAVCGAAVFIAVHHRTGVVQARIQIPPVKLRPADGDLSELAQRRQPQGFHAGRIRVQSNEFVAPNAVKLIAGGGTERPDELQQVQRDRAGR